MENRNQKISPINQGWVPKKRKMVEKNFDPYIGDGEASGGIYTQEDVKDIVAYAEQKQVTIIPEIELPGHSTAVLPAYPEFGNETGHTR
jgi:hexosaminidase